MTLPTANTINNDTSKPLLPFNISTCAVGNYDVVSSQHFNTCACYPPYNPPYCESFLNWWPPVMYCIYVGSILSHSYLLYWAYLRIYYFFKEQRESNLAVVGLFLTAVSCTFRLLEFLFPNNRNGNLRLVYQYPPGTTLQSALTIGLVFNQFSETTKLIAFLLIQGFWVEILHKQAHEKAKILAIVLSIFTALGTISGNVLIFRFPSYTAGRSGGNFLLVFSNGVVVAIMVALSVLVWRFSKLDVANNERLSDAKKWGVKYMAYGDGAWVVYCIILAVFLFLTFVPVAYIISNIVWICCSWITLYANLRLVDRTGGVKNLTLWLIKNIPLPGEPSALSGATTTVPPFVDTEVELQPDYTGTNVNKKKEKNNNNINGNNDSSVGKGDNNSGGESSITESTIENENIAAEKLEINNDNIANNNEARGTP